MENSFLRTSAPYISFHKIIVTYILKKIHYKKYIMKKLVTIILAFALFTIIISGNAKAQVDVNASGGTLSATYANLKLAFDAINAGTHTGIITINITGSGTYTDPAASAVLNSSGAGSASYTSILIQPTADGVSIFATQAQGKGVIELNGADNVTIDGDNPNSLGTNKNLTVYSLATATTTYASVIRIANSAAVTSSDNITIKNSILNGNATGRNASGISSSTGSENTTFGIYIGGNGGSTVTTAPTAITSVTSNSAPSGTTVNALLLDNNDVNQCARGMVFNGAASTVSNGVSITNNIIGGAGTLTGTQPFTTPSTTVYTKGIWIAGTTAITITGNTIRNILSFVSTSTT